MPVYKVSVGDAKYKVTAPDENTAWQWANMTHNQAPAAPAPTTPAPTTPEQPTPAPEEDFGFLDTAQFYTTDIPVRVLRGALTGVRGLTNLAGADNPVSELLSSAEEGITEYFISDTAKQEAEQRAAELEGKGFFETLAAAPGLLVEDPGLLADVVGTAVPAILAGMASGGIGTVGTVAGLGVGGGMGAGFVKESIYDSVRDEYVSAGASEEVAERAASEAQSYAGENLDMIALGTALGAVASRTGLEPGLARQIMSRAASNAIAKGASRLTAQEAVEQGLTRVAGQEALEQGARSGFRRGFLAEAPLEGLQGAQEQLAANLARRREGFDVDLFEGVGSAGALEGVLGGVAGGMSGRFEGMRSRAALRQQEAFQADAREAEEGTDEESRINARARNIRRDNPIIPMEDAIEMARIEDEQRQAAAAAAEATPAPPTTPTAAPTQAEFDFGPTPTTTGAPDDGGVPPTTGQQPEPDIGAGQPDATGTGASVPPTVGPGVGGTTVGGAAPAPESGTTATGGVGTTGPASTVYTGAVGPQPTPLANLPGTNPTARRAAARQQIDIRLQDPEFEGVSINNKKMGPVLTGLIAKESKYAESADPYGDAIRDFVAANPTAIKKAPTAEPAPAPAPTAEPASATVVEEGPAAAPAPTAGPAPATAPTAGPTPASVPEPVVSPKVKQEVKKAPKPKVEPVPNKPFVEYSPDSNVARSQSIDDDLFGFFTDMKNLLLGKDQKAYFTTVQDLKTNKSKFTPADALPNSMPIDGAYANGANYARKTKDGDLGVSLDLTRYKSKSFLIEGLSHELGHAHMYFEFRKAPDGVKKRVYAAYEQYIRNTYGDQISPESILALRKTAKYDPADPAHVQAAKELRASGVTHNQAIRASRTGRVSKMFTTDVAEDAFATPDSYFYIASFNEWYADQVARWAVTNEKPRTIVEKFFARVAAAMKRFYNSLKGKNYLPNTTFAQWMDDVTAKYAASVIPETEAAPEAAPEEAITYDYDMVADEIEGAFQADEAEGKSQEIDEKTYKLLMDAVQKQRATPERIMEELEKAKDRYAEKAFSADIAEMKSTVGKAEKKISSGMDKVKESGDRIPAEGVAAASSGHGSKSWVPGFARMNWLGRMFEAQTIMKTLPLDGLVNWAETKLGADLAKNLRLAETLMQEQEGMRADIRRKLRPLVEKERKFVVKGDNQNVLADARHFARIANVDLTLFKDDMSLAEAYKTDSIWKFYDNKLQDKNLDAKERKKFEKRKAKREELVKQGFDAWNKLGEREGGQEIYREIRKTYKNLYDTRRFYLEQRLKKLVDSGAVPAEVMIAYQLDQEKLNNTKTAPDPDSEDVHEEFPEVPLGLFSREYFPFKRFGTYSLRVKKGILTGPSGKAEPILKFYESKADRDADLAAYAERLGVSPSNSEFFETSNDVDADFADSNVLSGATVFKRSMEILNTATTEGEALSEAQNKRIQKQLYELYLLGTPEGSVRRRFIKSKNRAGFSADVTRVDATSFTEYADEIAKIKYGGEIETAVSSARSQADSMEGDEEPVTVEKKELLNRFADALDDRASYQAGDEAETMGKLAGALSHLTFYSFLTQPMTAMVQMVAIPVRVAPRLYADYGLSKGNDAVQKWSQQMIGIPALDKRTGVGSIRNKNAVKGNPLFRRAYDLAQEKYNLFEPLSTYVMRNKSTAGMRGVARALDTASRVATFLFDSSERLSREVAFMAAFELEYDKLKGSDMSQSAREEAAVAKAKQVVFDTLGNYNSYNRPPLMQGNALARAVFQFKQYAVITTKFFVENARTIVRGMVRDGSLTPGEGRRALKELTGVLGMNFLFAGAVGMPLWSIGIATLNALDLMDSDEDDEDYDPFLDGNAEAYLKYKFIPEHFGQPAFTGADGEQYELGDVLLRGPASTLSGWNIGSRVSLDLPSLWFFSSGGGGDTMKDQLGNSMLSNIPFASNLAQMLDGADAILEGDIQRGLERGLPLALARSQFKAYRLGSEGSITRSGDVQMSRDELSDWQIIGTVLGANPTELAAIQEDSRFAYEATTEAEKEAQAMRAKFAQVYRRRQNGVATAEDYQEVLDEIYEYNDAVPPAMRISVTSLARSIDSINREAEGDIRGINLTTDEAWFLSRYLD